MSWVTQKDIDDIRSFGITVIEQPGWKFKGDDYPRFNIRGFMLHHDAMALGLVNKDPSDDFNVPTNMGRPGVLGSQFWASTRGEVVVMAAGGKGHAGNGQWRDIPRNDGNSYCVALETDHTIGTGYSPELLRAIDVVTYVMVRNHGISVSRAVCGHKEYAPDRKVDPEGFDCSLWRERIATGNLFGQDVEKKDGFDMAELGDLERIVKANIPTAKEVAKEVWNFMIESQNEGKGNYSAQTFLGAIDKHTNDIPGDVLEKQLGYYPVGAILIDTNQRVGGNPTVDPNPPKE